MTINTTRYSPDTCSCVIDYDWDSTLDETNRVHTLKRFVNVCSAHQGLGNDTARWNVVFDENPKKNRSLETVLSLAPNGMYDIVNGVRQLKEGSIKFEFSWSGVAPDRVLTISFTGITLTTTQKNNIQSALNTRFGVGKVLIV